ncbi:MAG: PaaI family thioesterase [Eubacteriales bacterium]|nr:PaaI family thioesterase [Eubacteriales bacterium]
MENKFSEYMRIEITESNPDRAEGYMILGEKLTDEMGHVAGGAYNALADAIGGAAARATGEVYVTQGCSQQFYSSTESGEGKLFAKGEVRHRGSRTCIVAVQLLHGDGEVVCDGQFTYSKI